MGWGEIFENKSQNEKHNPCDKSLFLWGTCQVLRRKRPGMCRADHTNQGDKTTHGVKERRGKPDKRNRAEKERLHKTGTKREAQKCTQSRREAHAKKGQGGERMGVIADRRWKPSKLENMIKNERGERISNTIPRSQTVPKILLSKSDVSFWIQSEI